MLYRKNNQWALCPLKVVYKENGEQKEAYTHDKGWWERLANAFEHTEIISFQEVSHAPEQLDRLEHIKNMSEGFGAQCEKYVLTGEFPEGEHYDLAALLRTGAIKPHMIPEEYQGSTDDE